LKKSWTPIIEMAASGYFAFYSPNGFDYDSIQPWRRGLVERFSIHRGGVPLRRIACSVPSLPAAMQDPRMPQAVQTNRGSSCEILISSGHRSTYSAGRLTFVAAMIVLAKHQQITHLRGPEVAQCDLERPAIRLGAVLASCVARHAAIEPRRGRESNRQP
jgi:hypothetical protein